VAPTNVFSRIMVANTNGSDARVVQLQVLSADTNPPVITLLGDNPIRIETGNYPNDPGATALDDVDGVIYPSRSGLVNVSAPGDYLWTYTAQDLAGNPAAPVTRTVKVYPTGYYAWAGVYSLSGANFELTADPDGDGLNNLTEFSTGSNPTVSDLNSAPVASGAATLAAVPQGAVGYALSGERVGNLFSGNFSDAADAARTSSLFVTRVRPVIPDKTAGEVINDGSFAALKSNGSVLTWGNDGFGGDSSNVTNSIASGVVEVFSASQAFAALKNDGSVVTWGDSGWGGDSSGVSNSLTNGVKKVFSTSFAFAALKDDGSVVVWGLSAFGGDSSAVSGRLSNGVMDVVSTGSSFAALKGDGSVVTWGRGDWGGDSSSVSNAISSGVVRIFATTRAFAALKQDGSVVTWGSADGG